MFSVSFFFVTFRLVCLFLSFFDDFFFQDLSSNNCGNSQSTLRMIMLFTWTAKVRLNIFYLFIFCDNVTCLKLLSIGKVNSSRLRGTKWLCIFVEFLKPLGQCHCWWTLFYEGITSQIVSVLTRHIIHIFFLYCKFTVKIMLKH